MMNPRTWSCFRLSTLTLLSSFACITTRQTHTKAIPIRYFVSHRPTDPFLFLKRKKIQNQLAKEANTLIYNHKILFY